MSNSPRSAVLRPFPRQHSHTLRVRVYLVQFWFNSRNGLSVPCPRLGVLLLERPPFIVTVGLRVCRMVHFVVPVERTTVQYYRRH